MDRPLDIDIQGVSLKHVKSMQMCLSSHSKLKAVAQEPSQTLLVERSTRVHTVCDFCIRGGTIDCIIDSGIHTP